MQQVDEYHCNCFLIYNEEERIKLQTELELIGAYDQLAQENHRQKWARTVVIDDFWQIHIKMMLAGQIECEIEPRITFQEHRTMESKPAHIEMQQLLEKLDIGYGFIQPTPYPCKVRHLHTPDNPTDISKIVISIGLLSIGAALLAAVLYYIGKKIIQYLKKDGSSAAT